MAGVERSDTPGLLQSYNPFTSHPPAESLTMSSIQPVRKHPQITLFTDSPTYRMALSQLQQVAQIMPEIEANIIARLSVPKRSMVVVCWSPVPSAILHRYRCGSRGDHNFGEGMEKLSTSVVPSHDSSCFVERCNTAPAASVISIAMSIAVLETRLS